MGSATETATATFETLKDKIPHPQHKEPLKTKGVLDKFDYVDVTPVIGREYPTINLKEVLEAPNSDELLRDLAITSKFNWKGNAELC